MLARLWFQSVLSIYIIDYALCLIAGQFQLLAYLQPIRAEFLFKFFCKISIRLSFVRHNGHSSIGRYCRRLKVSVKVGELQIRLKTSYLKKSIDSDPIDPIDYIHTTTKPSCGITARNSSMMGATT